MIFTKETRFRNLSKLSTFCSVPIPKSLNLPKRDLEEINNSQMINESDFEAERPKESYFDS